MSEKTKSKEIINSGLSYLLNLEVEEITKVSCYESLKLEKKVREFQVVFPVGFVLNTLGLAANNFDSLDLDIDRDKLEKKISRLSEWLRGQKSEKTATYNYFTREFADETEYELPDDSDDTVLMIASFYRANEEVLEKSVLSLMKFEQQAGGPYRTWLVKNDSDTPEIWLDVDPVVNAHIAYAAQMLSIELAGNRKYLENLIINQKDVTSPYYPYKLTFYYYLAKAIKEGWKFSADNLKNTYTSKVEEIVADRGSLDPTEKVMYYFIKSVITEDPLKKQKFTDLLALQKKSGGSELLPICYDFTHNDKQTITTNHAFSTAIWVELLINNYLYSFQGIESVKDKRKIEKEEKYLKAIQDNITRLVQRDLFRERLLEIFSLVKMKKSLGLPQLILAEVLEEGKKEVSEDKQIDVLTLSYLGWTTYELIDMLNDKELSVNHVGLFSYIMKILEIKLKEILSEAEYNEMFKLLADYDEDILRSRDDFNSSSEILDREIQFAPFSFFLSRIPKIIDPSSEYSESKLNQVVKNILILEQLDDDAHDWEEDIDQGVHTQIIQMIAEEVEVDLDQLSEISRKRLKEVYWKSVMVKVIKIAEDLVENSSEMIADMRKIDNKAYKKLESLLQKQAKSFEKAKSERKSVLNILSFYSEE